MNTKQHTISNTSVFQQVQQFATEAYQLCNLWMERQKTRRELAQLPAHLLRDIGLSEADRYQESSKYFWED